MVCRTDFETSLNAPHGRVKAKAKSLLANLSPHFALSFTHWTNDGTLL